MSDVLLVAILIAFFMLAIGLVRVIGWMIDRRIDGDGFAGVIGWMIDRGIDGDGFAGESLDATDGPGSRPL